MDDDTATLSKKYCNHVDDRHRRLDGGIDIDPESTYVDIVILPIPASCSRSSADCLWVELRGRESNDNS
jgi:hypothetical protein